MVFLPLNTFTFDILQHTINLHMCDGFRALAAVSPGCLATVVKSHRTWITDVMLPPTRLMHCKWRPSGQPFEPT